MENIKNLKEEIEELKRQITEKKSSLPAHSIKPSMLQEIEDLEEKLEIKINKLKEI